MGIDSGNNAEKAIAMELKHLNKKLDRLIDILANSMKLKVTVDEKGITMGPNHLVVDGLPKTVYKNDVPLCVDPEN